MPSLTHTLHPLTAPFFINCISEEDLDEMNIEIIRNTLYKEYLEVRPSCCDTHTPAHNTNHSLPTTPFNLWKPF